MTISIECAACRSGYRVDDSMAGKRVKCRKCGGAIVVPAREARVAAVLPGGEPVQGGEALGEGRGLECLGCGAGLPPGTRVCMACGFDFQTGTKQIANLVDMSGEELRKRKNRWLRTSGLTALELVDRLLKLGLPVVYAGALGTAAYRIGSSASGLSVGTLLPLMVVLAALMGFLAPLMTLSMNATVRAMRIDPREDTYVRVVLAVLMPFAASLYLGWPQTVGQWGWAVSVAWVMAAVLLVYFFRAEPLEFVTSTMIAGIALGIGCLALNVAGGPIAFVTGPLNGEMLPAGPWGVLATGHSGVVAGGAEKVEGVPEGEGDNSGGAADAGEVVKAPGPLFAEGATAAPATQAAAPQVPMAPMKPDGASHGEGAGAVNHSAQ